jgi:NADPH:quinone reductase-like Zn-dependent oxidoreductase
LENLVLEGFPQAQALLEAGQVRVAVRAAGVNFRDVLIALGMCCASLILHMVASFSLRLVRV